MAVLLVTASDSAWGAEVTVRAHTSISTEADAAGRQVRLGGTLRDNLYQGMAEREVSLSLQSHRPLRRGAEVAASILTTDQNGRFEWSDRLPEGRWTAVVSFAGDALLAAAETEVSFTVAREQPRIELQVPAGAPIAAGVPVAATLLGSTPAVAGQALELRFGGRHASELLTDAVGEARVHLTDLPEPGRRRLQVSFEGGDLLAPVASERWVVLFERAALELGASVEELREGRQLLLSGRLSSDVGPIPRARVILEIPGHDGDFRVVTDDAGAFVRTESIDWLEPGGRYDVRAHYDPLGASNPDLRVSAVAPFAVPPNPLASASRFAGIVALLLLIAAVAAYAVTRLFVRLRRRRELGKGAPLPGRVAPEGLVELGAARARGAEERRVSGRVRDADTGQAVESGTVAAGEREPLPIATDGSFSTAPLPDGTIELVVRVSGYAVTRFKASIPHRGRYTGINVYVCSVRSWVRYLYQALTLELDLQEGSARWGRATPRQIEGLLMEAVTAWQGVDRTGEEAFREQLRAVLEDPALVPAERVLRALTLLVEEVYYSGRLYEEEIIGLCRSLVNGVKEVAQGAEPRGLA